MMMKTKRELEAMVCPNNAHTPLQVKRIQWAFRIKPSQILG